VLTGSGAKYRATRLIRTEGNHISGQAVVERFEDAGIEKYLYRALLELRTCKRCGGLDGKSFPVSEQKVGVNMHPMHPNCRCFISPDMTPEELAEITRSAQTGADNWEPIPANMTWEEWRKKYVDGKPEMQKAKRPKKKGEKTQKPLAKSGEKKLQEVLSAERVEKRAESGIMKSNQTEERVPVQEIAKNRQEKVCSCCKWHYPL
jgi:SPP1 gp7 family putative phage head morphogenesis protein